MLPIPLLDLVFLLIERQDAPSNVGLLMLFEPPAGRGPRSAALAAVRAYRAARPAAPFNRVPALPALGLPHWKRAPRPDMRYHVRQATLPAPGGDEQLWQHVASIHKVPLDRSRALFEVHFIDGLADGRFAVFLKSHHATWDGRSALARVLCSLNAQPGEVAPPFFAAQPALRTKGVMRGRDSTRSQTLVTRLLQEMSAARELLGALAGRAARPRQDTGAAAHGNTPFGGPHTRFNEGLCGERSCAGFSLPIAQMRQVADAFDGTLNDVVLAVVDAGVRRYLAAHGERPPLPFVAMCPVSQRDPGDLAPTIKVATMFVRLGEPRSDVSHRLLTIIANTATAKRELATLSKTAARDYAMLAFGAWGAAHLLGLDTLTRPVVNLVVSNVGGEAGPRYLGRNRLVGAYPMSMISDPTGLNVSLLSSDGRMDFGIVADRRAVPDAAAIASRCVAAFAQLRRAARRRVSA